uniref:Uncharacterized protein n=1 Tax=Myoviridae sp. ctsIb3 TaxID=2825189 RepID=A0A8S5URD9_9CAUD|nr:MAG TPA: hypothetical protein [Myoviridae sp. ctsIb3]
MPKYHVVVLCSGPVGDAALTYRLTASSPQAAEFHACQMAGDHYPEYRDIHVKRTEVLTHG